MKLSLFFVISLLWIGPCDDSFLSTKKDVAGTCVDVSKVAEICGEAVLKIESKEHQSLGETWNGNEHVFFTVIPCGSDDLAKATGTFKVLIKESNTPEFGDCVRCKATVGYTGKNKYEIALPADCSN